MAATLRELRGRIRSAGSIKKITKAQEMIATSRISKAQARVEAARPYASEITNMFTDSQGSVRWTIRYSSRGIRQSAPACWWCRRIAVSAVVTTRTCCVSPRSCSRCCVKRARIR